MAGGEEFREELVEECDFAGRADDGGIELPRGVDPVFDFVEYEGMLADLTELHDGVVETLDAYLLSEARR